MSKRRLSDPFWTPRTVRQRMDFVNAINNSSPDSPFQQALQSGVRVANRFMPRTPTMSAATQIGSSILSLLSNRASQAQAPTNTQGTVTDYYRRRGRSQNAYLAGKVRKFKKVSKKKSIRTKKGRRSTQFGLAIKGVRFCEELRFTSKTDQVAGSRFESIRVGHTSMPNKNLFMHTCRAIVKYCLSKVLNIRDFYDKGDDVSKGYYLNGTDTLVFQFYGNWDSNVLNNITVTYTAGDTFEAIAANLHAQLKTYATPTSLNIKNLRWSHFQYNPATSSSKYTAYRSSLKDAVVECYLKSAMKVQNRTITTVGENEADDVDNVPLRGFVYHLKGNNMVQRSERKCMLGVDSGNNTQYDNTILYEGITKNMPDIATNQAIYTGNVAYTGADATYSVFNTPGEPPKPYELVNCKKATKIHMNPGAIKTSILTQRFKMSLSAFLALLADDAGVTPDKLKYNPKQGFTRVMHLEKVIGNDGSSVAIAAEVQYDAWIAVTAKPEKTYSNPIQMQVDLGIKP